MKYLIVLSFVSAILAQLSCKDSEGNSADWWMAIKKPNSYDYALYTGSEWSSSGSLEDESGPLYETLKQLYVADPPSYAFYNDHPVNGTEDFFNAHMKGILAFTSSGGFWLVHSAPRYPPPLSAGYSYPYDETEFGQNFFCISVSLSTIESIATSLLMTSSPNIYDYSIAESLKSQLPSLYAAINNQTSGLMTNELVFKTTGGVAVTGFAKSGQWGKDLYEDLVASTLEVDLYTETWQQGSDDLPSYCKPQYPWDVTDIKYISVSSSFAFDSYDDHSKWVISTESGTEWVCFGDMNRETSQRTRGGGTYCLQDSTLHSATMKIISDKVTCSTTQAQ